MRHHGLVPGVDRNAPALVGLDARLLEVEVLGRALATGGDQHHVGSEALAALQHEHGVRAAAIEPLDLLTETDGHTHLSRQHGQRVDQLTIDHVEQRRALVEAA